MMGSVRKSIMKRKRTLDKVQIVKETCCKYTKRDVGGKNSKDSNGMTSKEDVMCRVKNTNCTSRVRRG